MFLENSSWDLEMTLIHISEDILFRESEHVVCVNKNAL